MNERGPRVWLRTPADTPAATGFLATASRKAKDWATGRNPWIRIPLVLWLAWIFVHHLRDPDYASLIGGLNLGVHELGHFVFAPFGDFMAAAGGTLLQCIAPIVAILMFRRQNDWFAITFATGWLATNFYNIAPYAADARARALPLVSPGAGDPIHDWYYMLARVHALQSDQLIGSLFRFAGTLTMSLALAAAAWLLLVMIRTRGQPAPPPTG